MVDSWNEIRENLNKLDDDEKEEMTEYFNEIIQDDEDRIGDVLFGEDDPDTFEDVMNSLNERPKKTLCDAFINIELIDADQL